MPNYSAKIFGNSVSGLKAQQALLAITSNNIANVNTPGYARRTANLETVIIGGNTGIQVGSGVQVGDVVRNVDQYLESALREALGDKGSIGAEQTLLEKLNGLFNITGEQPTIGKALTSFFASMNDLAADPSSLELRANVVEKAQDLTIQIQTTYKAVASLQDEADDRIGTAVTEVNNLLTQIAELNGRIAQQTGPGGIAADEKDRQDVLINKLSEYLSFDRLEQADGQVLLSLSNGFPLVNGTEANQLEVTDTPTFATGAIPNSLSGGVLSFIVFNYGSSATPSHLNLTTAISRGTGELAGLLSVRGIAALSDTTPFQASGPLVQVASRIEAIARTLLTSVNQTYLGPDANSAAAGFQPSAADLNGAVPATYGLFDFTYGGTKDVDADGNPDDLAAIATISSYANIITTAFTDPARVAAARDLDPAAPFVVGPGDGSNAKAVADLERSSFTFSAGSGSYSLTGTFSDAYNETVTYVGNKGAAAISRANVIDRNLVTAQNQRDEVSGVSLDEEFTNLIRFQKAYQASARLVKIADDLMTQIIQLI